MKSRTGLSYISLTAEKACLISHQHNSFCIDQNFLKLADEVDMDEISGKFEHVQIGF